MIPCERCASAISNGCEYYPCGKSKLYIKRLIFALSIQMDYPYNQSLKNVTQRRLKEANKPKGICPLWKCGSSLSKQKAFQAFKSQQNEFQSFAAKTAE